MQYIINDKTIIEEKKAILKRLQAEKKEKNKIINKIEIHYIENLLYDEKINFYDYGCYNSQKNRCFLYTLFGLSAEKKERLDAFIIKYDTYIKKVLHGHAEYAPEQKKKMLVFKTKKELKKELNMDELNKKIAELKASIKFAEKGGMA